MKQTIKPGMFIYTDNSISEELIPERQVKAVVGYIENNTVYALSCIQSGDTSGNLEKILANQSAINDSLEKMGAGELGDFYWSSTQNSADREWGSFSHNERDLSYKNNKDHIIRSILEIKL